MLAVAVIAAALGSVVFVDETEWVIVERFGVITAVYDQLGEAKSDRGLHFKLPWPIETVRRFDRRLQLFDPRGREMFTSDRKNIIVDTYLCWRISGNEQATVADFGNRPAVKFYRGLGTISTAEARLDTRVRAVLAAEMGKLALSDLLSVTDSEAGPQGASPLASLTERVRKQVQQQTDEAESMAERFGIEIVDIGIQRINLPEGNLFAVYERMRKERNQIAQRYRSAGEAEKLMIESQAKRRSSEILAKAGSQAAKIRATGEAAALQIRNTAHARDPEFYAWLRNLESYQKILNSQTTLVLSASSPFLKLLTDGVPQQSTSHPKSEKSAAPEGGTP
ncbi:MAG: protease modulator HflC [Planctomycetaceae bacterium]|nr:protease modulator HflC [Planctomycetaceae bacterium]